MIPSLFTLIQNRAPLDVIAAKLRDIRLRENYGPSPLIGALKRLCLLEELRKYPK